MENDQVEGIMEVQLTEICNNWSNFFRRWTRKEMRHR